MAIFRFWPVRGPFWASPGPGPAGAPFRQLAISRVRRGVIGPVDALLQGFWGSRIAWTRIGTTLKQVGHFSKLLGQTGQNGPKWANFAVFGLFWVHFWDPGGQFCAFEGPRPSGGALNFI